MKHKSAVAAALLVPVLILFPGCQKEQNVHVHIGIQPSAAFAPLYAMRHAGTLEKALAPKNISVVWQDFASGPPMLDSLSAELTDIGVIGDVPTVLALADDTPMKLIGIPARGADAYALIARADNTALTSAKDLKGKRIATVFGSTGHNFTKKLLETNELSLEAVAFQNIQAGQAEEMLAKNTADAVAIWEPNITRLVNSGAAKIIARGSETDLQGTNGFIVREEFVVNDSSVLHELLACYKEAAERLQALDQNTQATIAEGLSIEPELLPGILSKYDFSPAITGDDINSLQDTVRFLVSIGNLKNEYAVERYIVKIF